MIILLSKSILSEIHCNIQDANKAEWKAPNGVLCVWNKNLHPRSKQQTCPCFFESRSTSASIKAWKSRTSLSGSLQQAPQSRNSLQTTPREKISSTESCRCFPFETWWAPDNTTENLKEDTRRASSSSSSPSTNSFLLHLSSAASFSSQTKTTNKLHFHKENLMMDTVKKIITALGHLLSKYYTINGNELQDYLTFTISF